MKKKFNVNKTIEEIDAYLGGVYAKDSPTIDKPFYHYNEWSGWRFYLKAIKHRDWKGIIGHIKSNLIN